MRHCLIERGKTRDAIMQNLLPGMTVKSEVVLIQSTCPDKTVKIFLKMAQTTDVPAERLFAMGQTFFPDTQIKICVEQAWSVNGIKMVTSMS